MHDDPETFTPGGVVNLDTAGYGQVSDVYDLIPDARYVCAYNEYSTVNYFGIPKVRVCFTICEGEYKGVELKRWYRVKRLIGIPKKSGDFETKFVSDLFRDYVRLTGKRPRRDRISFLSLRGLLIEVVTRTSTHDHRRAPLPRDMWYSTIDHIVGLKDSDP